MACTPRCLPPQPCCHTRKPSPSPTEATAWILTLSIIWQLWRNTGDTANRWIQPGVVNYEYSIGTYEVTSDQWAAVAGFDALVENNSNDPWTGSQPTANASWYEAAKFANWLTSGNALQGAYTFSNSTTFTGVDRDTALTTFGTIYVLPTEDEWYKAAYLKSDGSGYTTLRDRG